MTLQPAAQRVLALSGGIGGAKLALGLSRVLAPGTLTIAANTGDDFRHLGLAISPDVDTLLYTLGGLADPDRGWGRHDETWSFMAALAQLGGETWFNLGDRDLALHIERTRRLAEGETLGDITADLARRLAVPAAILPMSDDAVRTRVLTDSGWIGFQDYFVRQRCEPSVRDVAYAGADVAAPHPLILEALADPALRAVVVCPSNPMLSIEPMLALPGMRDALRQTRAPVVAVSPIIAGQAVKGPTAKLMAELGLEVSASEVANRYADFLDAFVVDAVDTNLSMPRGIKLYHDNILMQSLADRDRLARLVLAVADEIAADRSTAAVRRPQ